MKDDDYDVRFAPTRAMHVPRQPRGGGRGLGKPIRRDGKWVGQSYMVFEPNGKVSFVRQGDTRV